MWGYVCTGTFSEDIPEGFADLARGLVQDVRDDGLPFNTRWSCTHCTTTHAPGCTVMKYVDLAFAATIAAVGPGGNSGVRDDDNIEKQIYCCDGNKMPCPTLALVNGLDRQYFTDAAGDDVLDHPDLTSGSALLRHIHAKSATQGIEVKAVLENFRNDPTNELYDHGKNRPISAFNLAAEQTISAAVPPFMFFNRKSRLHVDLLGRRPDNVPLAQGDCWRAELVVKGEMVEATLVANCRDKGNDQGETTFVKNLCGDNTAILASLMSHLRVCVKANGDYHSGGLSPFDKAPVIALYIKKEHLVNSLSNVVFTQMRRGFGDSAKCVSCVVCLDVCCVISVCVFFKYAAVRRACL